MWPITGSTRRLTFWPTTTLLKKEVHDATTADAADDARRQERLVSYRCRAASRDTVPPDRRLAGCEPDQIERPSIVVAVAGKREQALRFDPFSTGAHFHIRPGLAEQIPLPVADGQSPLDATMAFFEKPLRFR
jgi:hypothetical protein